MKKFGIILILIFILLVINFAASKLFFKIDLTKEKLYTLSKSTKSIIDSIDDEVTIKYFFSASDDTVPIVIKNYGKRIEELFKEFASYSPFIRLENYDVKPDTDEEMTAVSYGLNSITVLDSQPFYMGATVIYKGKSYSVAFFDIKDENYLEYEIANMLVQVKKEESKNTLGIISSFKLNLKNQFDKNTEAGFFLEELKKSFTIKILDYDIEEIPKDISVLLVLHPVEMITETEYAIEQYILNGGKVALIVDPSARSFPNIKETKKMPKGIEIASKSNFKYLFKTIGIQYDEAKVLADNDSAASVMTNNGMTMLYPFWLSISEKNFNKENFITKDLKTMILPEAGFFIKENYDYFSLIDTSKSASYILASEMNFIDPTKQISLNKLNDKVSLAGIVSGKFQSAFKKKPEDSLYSKKHIKEAVTENSVLVISDIDFISNRFAFRVSEMYGKDILQELNQNVKFLSNCLEFLKGETRLATIRSRGAYLKPFDKVLELEKEAQAKWSALDMELGYKINQLEAKLNALHTTKDKDGKLILSKEQELEIQKFKKEQVELKKKRRLLRKELRQDIEKLGNILTIINLTILPTIVLIFGMYVYFKRHKFNLKVLK